MPGESEKPEVTHQHNTRSTPDWQTFGFYVLKNFIATAPPTPPTMYKICIQVPWFV